MTPRWTGRNVVIWTTTPWTIPSNKAVVFRADMSYGLYEVTGTPEECWAKSRRTVHLWPTSMAADVLSRARLDEGMWRRLRDVDAG